MPTTMSISLRTMGFKRQNQGAVTAAPMSSRRARHRSKQPSLWTVLRLPAVALVLTVSAATASDPAMGTQAPDLSCTLIQTAAAIAGGPVQVTFQLKNRSAEGIWILKWNTPLEGRAGPNFEITHDGLTLTYRGPMIKRGDPDRSEYAFLQGGGSLTATVDLADAYAMDSPGLYQVHYRGVFHDWAWQSGPVPKPRAQHNQLVPGCNRLVIDALAQ